MILAKHNLEKDDHGLTPLYQAAMCLMEEVIITGEKLLFVIQFLLIFNLFDELKSKFAYAFTNMRLLSIFRSVSLLRIMLRLASVGMTPRPSIKAIVTATRLWKRLVKSMYGVAITVTS